MMFPVLAPTAPQPLRAALAQVVGSFELLELRSEALIDLTGHELLQKSWTTPGHSREGAQPGAGVRLEKDPAGRQRARRPQGRSELR